LASLDARAALTSIHFVLDVANISRGGGDLLDPLLVAAILDANQAVLHGDPALQRLYGDDGSALPDALRRPIRVHALSLSLRLPFETVRRRIRRLAEQGVCQLFPAGAVVPHAVVTSPAYVVVQAARVARLARLEAELVAAGLIESRRTALADGRAGARSADRALAGYMLRACDQLIGLTGSAMNGFLLLGLAGANTATLAPGPGAVPLGEVRGEPVSASLLARRLHMPSETVRRNLFALAAQGFAERSGRDWIVAAPAAAHSQLARLEAENRANLQRLFARLAELGGA
jgi:hypothetical protein